MIEEDKMTKEEKEEEKLYDKWLSDNKVNLNKFANNLAQSIVMYDAVFNYNFLQLTRKQQRIDTNNVKKSDKYRRISNTYYDTYRTIKKLILHEEWTHQGGAYYPTSTYDSDDDKDDLYLYKKPDYLP